MDSFKYGQQYAAHQMRGVESWLMKELKTTRKTTAMDMWIPEKQIRNAKNQIHTWAVIQVLTLQDKQ